MNSGLRKAHKYSWLLLVMIIPVIMIFALKDVAFFSENDSVSIVEPSKGAILKVVENDLIKASLYSNSIEIILKSTLKNASAVLYNSDVNGNKDQVIGQMSTAGIYTFNIQTPPKSIMLYDELKEELITKFDF